MVSVSSAKAALKLYFTRLLLSLHYGLGVTADDVNAALP